MLLLEKLNNGNSDNKRRKRLMEYFHRKIGRIVKLEKYTYSVVFSFNSLKSVSKILETWEVRCS